MQKGLCASLIFFLLYHYLILVELTWTINRDWLMTMDFHAFIV